MIGRFTPARAPQISHLGPIFSKGDEIIEVYTLRRTSHWPSIIPEANPKTNKPIFAAKGTSAQNKTEKTTAKTKNRIDRPIRALFDFIVKPPLSIIELQTSQNSTGQLNTKEFLLPIPARRRYFDSMKTVKKWCRYTRHQRYGGDEVSCRYFRYLG